MKNSTTLDSLHEDYKAHELVYLYADLAVSNLSLARAYANVGLIDKVLERMDGAKNILGEKPPGFAHRNYIDDAWKAAANLYNQYVKVYNEELGLEMKVINELK